jgi:DegV family protein with EDD domain
VSVGVVVDSVGCVPADVAEVLGIEVVPLSVAMDGKTYRDGVDLSPQDFYRRLAAGPPYPTTSAASVAEYTAAYERMADRGHDAVLSVVLSQQLSANIDAATTAAEQVDIPVRVLDSRTAAAPQGMMAVAAARRAAGGASLDEVIARACEVADRTSLLAIVPDLMYLYRGGRLNPIQAGVGRLLQITPLVTIRSGAVEVAARERTLRRALDRMVAVVREASGGKPLTVWVMEAGGRELAEQVASRVQDAVPLTEPVRWTTFTPVMGAHTGPGTAGVGYSVGEL